MEPAVKKPRTYLILLSILILVVILVLVLSQILAKKQTVSQKKPSTTAKAGETQPIYNIDGTIQKITGNVFTISLLLVNQPTTYQVTIPASLTIGSQPSIVPYNFKTASSVPTVKAGNLKVGQRLLISSPTDLKKIEDNSFTAQAVSLIEFTDTINGIVKSLSGSNLVVEGVGNTLPPSLNSLPSKNYNISVDSDTELTSITPPLGKAQKIPLSSLVNGSQVIIYTDTDVSQSGSAHALKINLVAKP